ncbi:MAG: DNA/RNA helicase domain-containing protein [Chthoniobacterales bacterium]
MGVTGSFARWRERGGTNALRTCTSSESRYQTHPALHLSVAKRCLRAERYAEWVNHVLNWQPDAAARLMPELAEFPILLARDLSAARRLLRDFAGDGSRIGFVASSGAIRLRAEGIELKREFRNSLKYPDWFLRPDGDIRSSNQLEVAATEFECQGLELDWSGVCWGGDLIPSQEGSGWQFRKLHGVKWRLERVGGEQEFIRNKYRVLLTRARFGTVLFVPRGSSADKTRDPLEFDAIVAYLCRCGLSVAPNCSV